MQSPHLERSVASVPALYSDAYDIAQIMELYSYPNIDILSIPVFLAHEPQLEEHGSTFSIFAGPAVGLSPFSIPCPV